MKVPIKSCENVQYSLLDWISGHLSEAERQAMEKHITGCVLCQRELISTRVYWHSSSDSLAAEPSHRLRLNFYNMLADFQSAEQKAVASSLQVLISRSRDAICNKYSLYLAYSLVILLTSMIISHTLRSYDVKLGKSSHSVATTMVPTQQANAQTTLLHPLENPSATQRLQAIEEAYELVANNPQVLTDLFVTLNQDPNVNVRLAVLEALTTLSQEPALKSKVRFGLIHSLTKQRSPLVQLSLIDAMMQLEDHRSVDLLCRQLLQQDINKQAKECIKQRVQRFNTIFSLTNANKV